MNICPLNHELRYSVWSTKVSWCPECHAHFYKDTNKRKESKLMSDSARFTELQRKSARDVQAVGMVGASTSLEMVEYLRQLETENARLTTQEADLLELLEDLRSETHSENVLRAETEARLLKALGRKS